MTTAIGALWKPRSTLKDVSATMPAKLGPLVLPGVGVRKNPQAPLVPRP